MRTEIPPESAVDWRRQAFLSLLSLSLIAFLLVLFEPPPSETELNGELSALWAGLWPNLLAIYAISVGLTYAGRKSRFAASVALRKAVVLGFIPTILITAIYLGLAQVFSLDWYQTVALVAVGYAVAYFNLGATLLTGRVALDGGRSWLDGYRVLGDGKTVRGAAGGVLVSALVYAIIAGSLGIGFLVGTLTMVGDASASLLKRRFGIKSGASVPLLDQFDGLFFVLLLEGQVGMVGMTRTTAILLVVGVLLVQVIGNLILYSLGFKRVPW
jgi:CDP-2,3-bis-(O-geranylgeranyl)-sn-glycerol synthase